MKPQKLPKQLCSQLRFSTIRLAPPIAIFSAAKELQCVPGNGLPDTGHILYEEYIGFMPWE